MKTRQFTTVLLLTAFVLVLAAHGEEKTTKPPTQGELKKMLDDLGLKPTDAVNGSAEVVVVRDNFRTVVRARIANNMLVLLCRGIYVPRPGEVPASSWRKLLEMNDVRSPDCWLYDEQDRMTAYLRILSVTDLTPAALRKHLDGLHATLVAQKDIFNAELFASAMKPIEDDEYAKKQRTALTGTWKAVKDVYNGVVTEGPNSQKEENRFHLDFGTGRWIWGKADREFLARFEPGAEGPSRVSLYRGEVKVLYRGIYKIEGKTLLLCLDTTGQTFPEAFDGGAGKGSWLLTLQKE